ncbi:MAG: hypothetical protein RMK18_03310 [Armatimonadota bacterium]|nr:hypothetical protein [Armatimonadota bacterium]MCX7777053.1 hypothetical protein [Armatimonadota bacterium]MDW8024878.1 hypothetical protein [Armatimonadota bacterium]
MRKIALFIITAITSLAQGTPFQLVLEAEDFDGLIYLPFHAVIHPSSPVFEFFTDGWYVREANCRGYGTVWGNGKVAAIHSTSRERTMQKRLELPLPTGRYKITIRVVGTTMAEKLERDNILRVQIGDAEVDFRWRNVGRSFRWLPMKEFTLKRPADTVKVTAAQFGGVGVVHLNEAQVPSIWLDTIYLTDDPTETEPPSPERERMVKFGVDKLPLPEKRKPLWHEIWDLPFPFNTQHVRLQSFDGRKNLFPNGSFELGMPSGWAATNVDYTFCYIFTDADLDEQKPVHGQFCLKVPEKAKPFSRPFLLEKGGKISFSLFLRSEKMQIVRVSLRSVPEYKTLAMMDCQVNEKWQRFSVSGDVPSGFVDVRIENNETVWVDGIQLEYGSVSPFATRGEIEAGFSTGKFGNLLFCDVGQELKETGKQNLILWLHNDGERERQVSVRYRIVNIWEQVIAEGKTKPINVKPKTTIRLPFPLVVTSVWGKFSDGKALAKPKSFVIPKGLPSERNTSPLHSPIEIGFGIFSLQWAVDGRMMPEGELVFVVLPPIALSQFLARHEVKRSIVSNAKGNATSLSPCGSLQTQLVRHELAANMDILEHAYRLFSQMGFRWQLYCKFYPTFPDRVNPKESEWKWFDEQVELAQKFGLKTLPCLWASQPRPFLADWTKVPGETMGVTRNAQRYFAKDRPVYPDISKWLDYVTTLVHHYRNWLHFWCVEDETELYFTPSDFAPIFSAAYKAIKSVDANLQVGTSMCPQYHEELLELLNGQVDFIGASSWGASYWEARKIRWLQERWGKPWFCIGVGLDGQPSFYHTFPNSRPSLRDAAMAAQELVKLFVVQDAKIIGHYTGRIRNNGTHITSDFPLIDYDGTPLPFGAVYASIGRLLANAVPAGEIRLGEVAAGNSGVIAFLFEQGGRTHAVTWSNSPSGLYGHNVTTPQTAQSLVRTLTLRSLPKDSVRFTDCFGNEWQFIERNGKIVNVQLNPMPLFIWNERLSRSEFERILRNSYLSPDRVYGCIVALPNRENPERLDLLVRGRWLGGEKQKPDRVEVGTAFGQLMTENQWLLLVREQTIVDWHGNEFFVRLPTVLNRLILRHPLENAQMYAWVLSKGKIVGGIFDNLWLAIAPKLVPKIDGDLSEWKNCSPAWLDYSFSWARFGRWLEQVEYGGEYLKEFLSDVKFADAKVAFWCSWDIGNLYLAARIFDDQPKEGDELRVFVSQQPTISPSLFATIPLREGEWREFCEGKWQVGLKRVIISKCSNGWRVEANLNLNYVKPSLKLQNGIVIGFDLRYQDADTEAGKTVISTLRWAGASNSGCLWLSK